MISDRHAELPNQQGSEQRNQQRNQQRNEGARDLLFDVVDETTSLVERTHASVLRRTVREISRLEALAAPAETVERAIWAPTRLVYGAVRAVSRGVQTVVDLAADRAQSSRAEEPGVEAEANPAEPAGGAPRRSDAAGTSPWLVDQAEAVVNGMFGSYLAERGSGLDLGMGLRDAEGRPVAVEREALSKLLPEPRRKVVVFVHGLTATEWCWAYEAKRYYGDPATTFGTLLKNDLGYTDLYVRYNTGRHISESGRLLSELLESLVDAYPGGFDELALVGHSMGGLVIRSAAHQALPQLRARLRHIVCLASPHLGAPLEQGANLLAGVLGCFDTAGTQVPAELLRARSHGIKDLRYGYTCEDEWSGRDPDALFDDNRQSLPLLDGVGYFFVGATVSKGEKDLVGRLIGDVMVRAPSAAGQHQAPERSIPFRSGKVLGGMHHLDLASHPDVYAALRTFLSPTEAFGAAIGPSELTPKA